MPRKQTKPRPVGRPSGYTLDIASVILERMMHGRSIRAICKDDDMPTTSTVFKWLMENKEFSDQYARASEQRAEHIFEESLDIADDSASDYIETDKGPVFNQEHVQRARLRVDTRKWFVSKLAPKKYGEKTAHEHSVDSTLASLIEASMKGEKKD